MGTILHHYRQTLAERMIQSFDGDDTLQKEIDLLLSILPRGSKWISTEQKGITDLTIPFVIKFEHPLFADGSKIEIDYIRDIYTEIDPTSNWAKTNPINVLVSIKYFNPDGTERYKERI